MLFKTVLKISPAVALSILVMGNSPALSIELNAEMSGLLSSLVAQVKKTSPSFTPSVDEGRKFYLSRHAHKESKEERSCATCHTESPVNKGKTQVGKVIEPMMSSVNKDRFTDTAKVNKWFKRNCAWVLERECTPSEKANFITYLTSNGK